MDRTQRSEKLSFGSHKHPTGTSVFQTTVSVRSGEKVKLGILYPATLGFNMQVKDTASPGGSGGFAGHGEKRPRNDFVRFTPASPETRVPTTIRS